MENQNTTQPLYAAMEELQRMPKIDIKGKSYATVASRVEAFRRHFPTATIETQLVHDDEQRVIIQAQIRVDSTLVSTGFAEEFRGDGMINATSALENAETSAIGRGLSAAGLMGGEYASSFEVGNAISIPDDPVLNVGVGKCRSVLRDVELRRVVVVVDAGQEIVQARRVDLPSHLRDLSTVRHHGLKAQVV